MNFTEAKTQAAMSGCTLKRTEDGEYRVALKGAGEASAYYTNDLQDAVGTARAMEHQKQNRRARQREADRIDGYDRDDLGESPDY